ncbi:hypothetical protein FKM82_014179 [Ascaphus truei]
MVSGGTGAGDVAKPQQWVNCQMLLCKKCNNNQTTKIKQLASFLPREEDRYDEEIEVYKHHLEQMYKLCRPCQAAVEYYIKHQNRQLRAILLNHQLKRRESDKSYVQSFGASSSSQAPMQVIFLRFLAFLSGMFLVALVLLGSGDPFSSSKDSPGSPEAQTKNISRPDPAAGPLSFWEEVLDVLPEQTLENLNVAWSYGRNHQMGVVILGLLACVFAMVLAGRIRLRRVDAFAVFLWLLVTGLYLTERHLLTDSPSWLDTAKLGTTSLCCLVGFTAAVATRKATGPRRHRLRSRYLSGDAVSPFGSLASPTSCAGLPDLPTALLSTPPGLLQLMNQQLYRSQRRASPSSLPGRLSRALSLGTIPSLARADSGYLFSGSRPASLASAHKDSPGSDYFSLLSGSSASSPLPSPTPSVAGSATSSSGSLYHRRPLISPARLNLQGQKLGLSSAPCDGTQTRNSSEEASHPDSSSYPPEFPHYAAKRHANMKIPGEAGSVSSGTTRRKENGSSHSSACQVDTTTGNLDSPSRWRGCGGFSLLRGLLVLSFAVNVLFVSVYLYPILS